MSVTQAQYEELARMKAYYPFRIVFGVIDKDTQEFEVWCKTTMHVPNKKVREGHTVVIYK